MLESSKVPALTRAIDILNLIARIGPCSAAIIIETLRIPKSTAYLLLNELKRQRFISLDHQENGNDSNLLIVFYVQIMPDDLVMQLHRF